MTSSGTFTFNPGIGDLVRLAYSRIQVRGPGITQEHMATAVIEAGLQQVEFSNLQPNLWKIATITQVLTQGTVAYSLPATTIMVMIASIVTGSGTSQITRVLGPLSATEYASIPTQLIQAPPTSFWFDRQIVPRMVLYPVPDSGGPYTLTMLVLQQFEDAVVPGGVTLNMVNRFLDAYTAGLTARLAVHYRPEAAMALRGEAERVWKIAATADTENVNMSIIPGIGGYYRR